MKDLKIGDLFHILPSDEDDEDVGLVIEIDGGCIRIKWILWEFCSTEHLSQIEIYVLNNIWKHFPR